MLEQWMLTRYALMISFPRLWLLHRWRGLITGIDQIVGQIFLDLYSFQFSQVVVMNIDVLSNV
jgi:hypothetical protein